MEGKEKPGFILWNLNPSHALYLKYTPNIPYSRKNELKGKRVQVKEVMVIKAT